MPDCTQDQTGLEICCNHSLRTPYHFIFIHCTLDSLPTHRPTFRVVRVLRDKRTAMHF